MEPLVKEEERELNEQTVNFKLLGKIFAWWVATVPVALSVSYLFTQVLLKL